MEHPFYNSQRNRRAQHSLSAQSTVSFKISSKQELLRHHKESFLGCLLQNLGAQIYFTFSLNSQVEMLANNCRKLHFMYSLRIIKSVNIQYITLGYLDDGTNESSTKSLMFQVLFFFILFIDLGHSKLFIFIFVIL